LQNLEPSPNAAIISIVVFWGNPFDPDVPLAGLGGVEHALDLLVKEVIPPVEILEENIELADGISSQLPALWY